MSSTVVIDDHLLRDVLTGERPQDLGLRRQRLVVEVEGLVDDAVPPVLVLGVGLHVGVVDPVTGQALRQRLQPEAGVGDQRDGGQLEGVERGDAPLAAQYLTLCSQRVLWGIVLNGSDVSSSM